MHFLGSEALDRKRHLPVTVPLQYSQFGHSITTFLDIALSKGLSDVLAIGPTSVSSVKTGISNGLSVSSSSVLHLGMYL